MDSVQFATAYVPTEIEVAGAHVRLFFTLQAAMKMEASLKRPYLETVLMMLQAEDENGKPQSLPLSEQAEIVRILMEEAGQSISAKTLMSLDMREFALLARAAQVEIVGKMPRSAQKNDAGEWRWEMILLAAKRVLGLTVDEFWHLTPTVFHALLEETIGENEQAPRKVQFADEIGW